MAVDPRVACIILNTNRREDTLACLRSLQASTYANFFILVLDCKSTDGSVASVRSAYPDVQVIELTDNRGYAGNNNVGIRAAMEQGADWVFILNEDTVLAPEVIERLVDVGRRDPGIGILGPLVYHYDEPQVIQSAGGRLTASWDGRHIGQNEDDRGQFDRPTRVDWISGCAILVRRAVIESLGAFDERFFIYWEETEWCVRTMQAGWTIMHVPTARIWHKGVQRDYRPKPDVTYYSTRNHLLMLQARRAPLAARVAVWLQIGRTVLSWSTRPKWRDKRTHRDAMWQGVIDHLRGKYGRRVLPSHSEQ